MFKTFYNNYLLKYPFASIVLLLCLVSLLSFNAKNLQIDASADTLLLEGDKDLAFLNQTNQTFQNKNFLVVSFSPKGDMFDKPALKTIKEISDKLLKLDDITAVTSILNVPLLQSPIMPVTELINYIPTIQAGTVDLTLAKEEFLTSAFYKNNIISSDLKTTAILLFLKDDIKREENHLFINSIREILKEHKSEGELFVGGVNMISDDMIEFIKTDLKLYGSILLLLMIVVLWIIFRELRWIVISVFISSLSILSAISILGLLDLKVTVISSNFISLQLIITISIVLHLIVRYRELLVAHPSFTQKELILQTMISKLSPSFFAILTTMVGFGSLVLSNILPVINLGWMMSSAILLSLFISFIFFPAFLALLPKSTPYTAFEKNFTFTKKFANIVEHKASFIFLATLFIIIFSISGASMLKVENSFINYFKKNTEIYQGLEKIDKNLGGTTPLDIVLTFKNEKAKTKTKKDDDFADFTSEFDKNKDEAQYWFTPSKMKLVEKVHDYLENTQYIGNVQSLATILKVGRTLNQDKDLDNFQLAILYNQIPIEFKKVILSPYVNVQNNQVRFAVRITDTSPNLRRDELIKKIQQDLTTLLKNENVEFKLGNLMILYNNMLQSLFTSQILTLGFVVLLIFAMFVLIFGSIPISIAAIIANIIPISVVFGLMGWFNIPLDMMSITIAAIGLGIGVDDTIHYIHRYKEELLKCKNPILAMHNSHESIGLAMYYTSLVISLGFLVLVFSNFIPTIYFGLLTVAVMSFSLLGALLLLPKLLIILHQKGYK